MADTKEKILEAAKKLFAKHGIEKCSLRMITREAGVNLAAINYHFGSKEHLVRMVILQFIRSLDQDRMRLLAEAEAEVEEGQPKLFKIVQAYIVPWARLRQEWPEYVRGIARTFLVSGRESRFLRRVMRDFVEEPYSRFCSAVFAALPGVPREELLLRINLAAALALSFLFNQWAIRGLEELSGIRVDEEMLGAHIVRILENGLEPGAYRKVSTLPAFEEIQGGFPGRVKARDLDFPTKG